MPYRTIKQWPHKCLQKKAEVATLEEIQWVSTDLIDTLKIVPGVGLAAPQIDIPKRVLVIDTAKLSATNPDADKGDPFYWVIGNPLFSNQDGKWVWEEACLSVPLAKMRIERDENLTMEYTDISGERKSIDLVPPLSLAVQHEFDHLEGKTILDRGNRFSADMYKRKIRKAILKAARRDKELDKLDGPKIGRKKKKTHLSAQEIKKRKKIKKKNSRKK